MADGSFWQLPPSAENRRRPDDWNGFNVLHTAAGRVGGLDIGFVPGDGGKDAGAIAGGDVDLLFLLGADELEIAKGAFTVYIGTHGDQWGASC
jgi:NADH-quinone oxidoreductase subunit G